MKNKVPSRFHRAPTHTSVHAPEAGPPVPVEQFAEIFDAKTVHLTSRVQRFYARLAGMVESSDLELHTAIRADAAQLPTGTKRPTSGRIVRDRTRRANMADQPRLPQADRSQSTPAAAAGRTRRTVGVVV